MNKLTKKQVMNNVNKLNEKRRKAKFYYNIIENYLKKSRLDAYLQPLDGAYYTHLDHQQCVRFEKPDAEDMNRFMKWIRRRTANQIKLVYNGEQSIEITY